ncbi:MAG: SPOR domain-containing protein [Acidobacteriota bacterium]
MASKTVLVIDADSETEQFIASILETEGYLVFAVPGGDVGAEMAQKVRPSLIFVNPQDTSKKGMEVCRAIRSYESLKTVPIILLASGSGGTDLGPYGLVDSLSMPVSAAELLEKTEKAINVKSPVVLRAREKALKFREDKMPAAEAPSPGLQEEVSSKSRLSDLSEIADMEEEGEEVLKGPQEEREESGESYIPEEEIAEGRKSKKALVALLSVLVIVVGVAGALYYSGMIPGIGLQTKGPAAPPRAVEKPKKPEASPVAEPAKQPLAEENTASAPGAVHPPATAIPAPHATDGKAGSTAASSAPAPASAKDVPAAKPLGKRVYSVQAGVFKNEKNAEALMKKLKEKGYEAFTVKSDVKGKGVIYRVLVGKFEDKGKSREMAVQISKKENIKTVIFSE